MKLWIGAVCLLCAGVIAAIIYSVYFSISGASLEIARAMHPGASETEIKNLAANWEAKFRAESYQESRDLRWCTPETEDFLKCSSMISGVLLLTGLVIWRILHDVPQCPACMKAVHPRARICPHCRSSLVGHT